MKVLITGANGFVGKALVSHLCEVGHSLIATTKNQPTNVDSRVQQIRHIELEAASDLSELLNDVDVLVHLAARVHIMNDQESDPLRAFRVINRDVTLNLAVQAAKAGVKRFIFLSTIKVIGESTTDRCPFSEEDECQPTEPYAISKLEAEKGLKEIASKTGLEVVIIRPPLIYGPGVKGNFANMMRWVSKQIPLPLGAINNQRSLLALDNLVDFITHCLNNPKATNEVFLLSDGHDVSTTELILKLALAQGKKARLLPVPVLLMTMAAGLFGKKAVADRLFGSLQVDSRKARELLEWSPVVSMDQQLQKMADVKSESSGR